MVKIITMIFALLVGADALGASTSKVQIDSAGQEMPENARLPTNREEPEQEQVTASRNLNAPCGAVTAAPRF